MQSAVCSLQSAVYKCHTPVLYWPVEQPNTSCEHIKLTFLFNVRSSWVILWSKSIWNKPNVSNLTSVILRWKEHLVSDAFIAKTIRLHHTVVLPYCTEVRLKIWTKKTDLLLISIGSKAPRDRVSHLAERPGSQFKHQTWHQITARSSRTCLSLNAVNCGPFQS